MATDIRVPTLGESVTEATIGRWFKKPGEPVKADEPLVELETDKVTLEVNAPAAGVLGDIVAKDGATVAPGAVLGSIVEGDGSGAKPAAPPKASAPPAAPAKRRRAGASRSARESRRREGQRPGGGAARKRERRRSVPRRRSDRQGRPRRPRATCSPRSRPARPRPRRPVGAGASPRPVAAPTTRRARSACA